MNGGALVAIPAAVALFGVDAYPVRLWIVVSGLFFVAGIGTAARASYLALLAANSLQEVAQHSRDMAYETTKELHGRSKADIWDTLKDWERATAAFRTAQLKAMRWGWSGFALFIVGGLLGGMALVEAPRASAQHPTVPTPVSALPAVPGSAVSGETPSPPPVPPASASSPETAPPTGPAAHPPDRP